MRKNFFPDVTLAQPGGALPKQSYGWKPLNTSKMNWSHRRTKFDTAPSLIQGKHYDPPGNKE